MTRVDTQTNQLTPALILRVGIIEVVIMVFSDQMVRRVASASVVDRGIVALENGFVYSELGLDNHEGEGEQAHLVEIIFICNSRH